MTPPKAHRISGVNLKIQLIIKQSPVLISEIVYSVYETHTLAQLWISAIFTKMSIHLKILDVVTLSKIFPFL